MSLITTLSEFNQFVTVSSDFDDEKFLKYTKKAERNIVKLIGKTKFQEIESLDTSDETRQLLCEYTANMGLSYALPAFVLNITNMGVFTNATTDSQRAEWWQMKDLNRSLLKFAFDALDEALERIGLNQISIFNELFVNSIAKFEKVFSIQNSTQTFLSLVPFMREVQHQYIHPLLGECLAEHFTDEQRQAIRSAIVNLALSKAAVSGSFSLEANAMILRVEVMPWEKIEKLEQSTLDRFREDRYNVGMGYLNQLAKLLKDLPCYQPAKLNSEIRKLNSGLYI